MIPKIFTFTNGDSADAIVDQYAKENGIHPHHIIRIQPEKTELTVEQMHLLQKDIQVSYSHSLLVVLQGVDTSSTEVQNSLLKSLEEESGRIHFLLLVQNPRLLLQTIRSRCTLIELIGNIPYRGVALDPETFFSLAHNTDSTKEIALQKIDSYITSQTPLTTSFLQHILAMRKLIIDNNVNPVMALDNILLFLHKTSTMKKMHEK